MKSKLFGNSAKMALAALVVCASLTSCYDLDGGSALIIPEPTPQTVSYVLTGKVTDAMSYQPISGATVTFAGGTATTGTDGRYETSEQAAPFNTDVTFSAEGYKDLVKNPGQGTATSGISTKVLDVEMVTTGHDDHDHDHGTDHDHDHDGGNGSGGGTGITGGEG